MSIVEVAKVTEVVADCSRHRCRRVLQITRAMATMLRMRTF